VLPEIITGLSLLLLFVAMEQAIAGRAGAASPPSPSRTSAFRCVCRRHRAARLIGFDESLEKPRLTGARPATVFLRITLPLIAPALLSGWLLSFTLSWDVS